MKNNMLRTGILIMLVWCGCAEGQQRGGCSRDRLRQCEDGLLRNIQRRVTDMTRTDMAAHCTNVRDDFNCLLRETRCLTVDADRNRNGDALRNGLKYIREGCDSAGGSWRDSSCFVGDTMKSCESSYPLGGVQYSSFSPETCRKYNLFYDCVMDTVRSRCRPEDELLLGQYLVDSGQDLAWNCGETTSTADFDRTRDRTTYDRNGGDRYGSSDRYNDRERDNYNNRGGGAYNRESDRDRFGSDRGRDRYPSGQYYPPGGSSTYNGRNDYVGSSDVTCCRTERCDRYRQSQCRDSLSRTIDNTGRPGNLDRQMCRKTRDDFNCLMWQTSHCTNSQDRDRDNDIFRRARDYISRQCDSYERWTDNSCYRTTEMQRCEALLTNTRGGANYESCRAFNSFSECMREELTRRCTRDDELFQGAYMVDKAQEMSWQCGTSQQQQQQYGGSRDSDRRDQYNTFDRRDQYDRQDGGVFGNNAMPHLEDEDSMCMARITSYTDQCKKTMDEKRTRDYNTENDFERRQRINCCSVREYRNCLYDATRRYCQTERSRVVDNLMAGYRHHLTSDSCVRIYDSECSSAHPTCISSSLALALSLAALLIAIKTSR